MPLLSAGTKKLPSPEAVASPDGGTICKAADFANDTPLTK